MSNDASWFKHDSNARHDIKIQYLRSVYGNAGYGSFWMIIEIMRDSNEYKIKYNDNKTIVAIARELEMKFDELKTFIDFCVDAELFETDTIYFWSSSLLKRLDKFEERKRQNQLNGTKGGRPRKEAVESSAESIEIKKEHIDKVEAEKPVRTKNATVAQYHSDVEYLTDLLIEKIKQNNNNAKSPNIDSWRKEINLMIEIDKYTFEQVARMIEFSQADDFWKSNILSAKKLREKSGTLILQMQRKKPIQKDESPKEMYNRLLKLMGEENEDEQTRDDSAIDVDSIIL